MSYQVCAKSAASSKLHVTARVDTLADLQSLCRWSFESGLLMSGLQTRDEVLATWHQSKTQEAHGLDGCACCVR